MRVPFGYIKISKETRKKIDKVLKNNKISQGEYVEELEKKFAEFVGANYAVAVSSGTDALTLMLATLEKNSLKNVIVPALSFPATWAAVIHAGYKVVPVDINLDTLNIDVDEVSRKMNKSTRAILGVHLMGKPFDSSGIFKIDFPDKHILLEDACEAHGSSINNKKVGSIGDMAAFSLYVSHILYAGEGGIITTNSLDYYTTLRSLRNHGRKYDITSYDKYVATNGIDQRFLFDKIGFNSKMTELQAILGLASLKNAEKNISKRRTNFLYYCNEFKNFSNYFRSYKEEVHEYISPHAFPILLKEDVGFTRDEFMKYLQIEKGIDCRTLFQSISSVKPYGITGKFPNAEYVERNGLHIGVHSGINKNKREYVIDSIKEFLENRGK